MKHPLKLCVVYVTAAVVTVAWAPLKAAGLAAEWMENHVGPKMHRAWKWTER